MIATVKAVGDPSDGRDELSLVEAENHRVAFDAPKA
jgi:hypothetical protein